MNGIALRSTMTFFSDPTCHYSHRVRIVLAEKDVTVDIVESDPNNPPRELADVNPYNSLPTLADRELSLYETKVMMEYLDERFPHPPLLPVYPVARSESRQFMHRIEQDWVPMIDEIIRNPETKAADKARKDLHDSLLSISPIFAEKPFFMSDEFSLVDCCLAPILWRLPSLGISIAETRQSKPLLAYAERMFNRASFKASLTEQEREMPRD